MNEVVLWHLLVKGPGGFEYVGPESQVELALKTLTKLQVFRSITRMTIAVINMAEVFMRVY